MSDPIPFETLIASGDTSTLTIDDRKALVAALRDAAAEKPVDLTKIQNLRAGVDFIDSQAQAVAAALDGLEDEDEEEEVEEADEEIAEETEEAPEAETGPEIVAEIEIEAPAEAPVAVAAAAKPKPVTRSRVQKNPDPPKGHDLVVARTVGLAAGHVLPPNATMADIGRVIGDFGRTMAARGTLVSLDRCIPQDRILGTNTETNNEIIARVASPQAIAAAGGICDPLPGDQTKNVVGDRSRPIRDALGTFGTGGRTGGLRYTPAFTLPSLGGAGAVVEVWDHATDLEPGEDTKLVFEVPCDDELTAYVDAVPLCLTIGNFAARFSGNLYAAALEAGMVAHDRVAEQNLLTRINAASTAVTYTGSAATSISTIFQAASKVAAGIRSRLRLNAGTMIQVIMDQWIRDALRADIAGQRLAAGSPQDQLAVTNGQIDAMFAARGISPIWSPDVDVFATQAGGALNDWPGGTTTLTAFPAGTHLFLDGGTLDFGIEIVDSALISVNNRQAFIETFEGVLHYHDESYTVTVPLAEDCICDVEAGEAL